MDRKIDNTRRLWRRFVQEDSAQGITAYGAILAFVAVLVALSFGLAHSHLLGSISAAFSSMANQLNTLTSYASNL